MARSGPAVLAGADGDAGVRKPGLLHRERGGGHRLLLHTSGILRMPDQRYIFTVASVYSILCTV